MTVVPAYSYIAKVNPRLLGPNPTSEVVFPDGVTIAKAYESTSIAAVCNV